VQLSLSELAKIYKVTIQPSVGDVCGKPSDCNGEPNQGAPNCIPNVVDVVCLINYIFRSFPPVCPLEGADITCDGITDVRDVVAEVGIVFRGQTPPDPCE
jgi:hypothetical protein